MAEYDGSIRIGVIMNTDKAQKTLQSLREKLVKQTQDVDDQVKAVQKLEAQYQKLISKGAEPKGIKKMENDLRKAQDEAARLDTELQGLQQMARMDIAANGFVSPETASRIQEVSSQMAIADALADELNLGLEKLRIPPESTEEAKKLKEQINAGKEKLEESKLAAQNTADRIKNLEGASQSWVAKLGQAGSRIKSTFGKSIKTSARSAKTLHSRMEKVGRSRGLDKARKSASKLSESLKRVGSRIREIVSGALLFNIISRALTALTKKMGEYLLANKSFANSLSTIKGNLLTAFQPIYEAVMPAINSLMETLREASAVAAKFIAQLFGTTAEKAQQNAKALHDQAKATEEVADETKKAEKFLASFDTIETLGNKEDENKKSDEKEEKAEAKFDQDYSDVKVPPWLEKLGEVIKSIKDALKDLFAPIKEAWDKYGAPVIEALKRAFSSVWELIKAIGRTFMEIWQSPLVQTTLKLIMDLLTLILNIIGDIADTFRKVWESGEGEKLLTNLFTLLNTILGIIYDIASAFQAAWSNYGESVVQALFFALNSVLELLNAVGQAFRDAWNDNGRGQKIFETILQIVRDIFNIVGELAGRLKEAWDANGNGKAIWAAILDSVQAVLDFIHKVTDATLEWAKNLDLEPLISSIRYILEQIAPIIEGIGDGLATIYQNIVLPCLSWLIETALPFILNILGGLLEIFAKHKDAISFLTQAVIAFIAAWKLIQIIQNLAALGKAVISAGAAMLTALDPTKLKIAAILALIILIIANFDKIKEVVKNVVGSIVQWFKDAAQAVSDFWNALWGKKDNKIVSKYSGGISIFNDSPSSGGTRMASMSNMARISAYPGIENIPHLAKGAVISPNSEFLAVLGDQRAGKNIESPLSTIEQALDNVLSRRGEGGSTNVEVNFTGSLSQLARILQPQIKIAEQRRGPSLINVGGSSYE